MADKFIEYRKQPTRTELKRENKELSMDSVTGLPQRKQWFSEANYVLNHAKRTNEKMGILFIDVDNLKEVNDNKVWGGHHMGDLYLGTFGSTIKEHLRNEDIGGRIGGDELVILVRLSGNEDIYTVAYRLEQNLKTSLKNQLKETDIPQDLIDFSMGSAVMRTDDTVESLVKRADEAMYKVKNAKKPRQNQM